MAKWLLTSLLKEEMHCNNTTPSLELVKGYLCLNDGSKSSLWTYGYARDAVKSKECLHWYIHVIASSWNLSRDDILTHMKSWEKWSWIAIISMSQIKIRTLEIPLVQRFWRKLGWKWCRTALTSKHFEVHEVPYLEQTHFHFALHFALHFLRHSEEYCALATKAITLSVQTTTMESLAFSQVYVESKKKEDWCIEASAIILIGASGTGSEMFSQLQYIIGKSHIPVDKDAARKLFDERTEARSKVRGLKNPLDHFGTHNQASFVLPLLRSCYFSSNPLITEGAKNCKETFPLVQWFNDPSADQRGGVYQKFIVQPWLLRTVETSPAGTLLLSSWVDVQSISDCYVMLYEKIAAFSGAGMSPGFMNRFQIVASRMRVENSNNGKATGKKSGEWRPWGFKILIMETEHQYADISLTQEILVDHPMREGKVNLGGANTLFIPVNIPLKMSHEKKVDEMVQSPYIILNGMHAPKLTYVLWALDAFGINMHDIVSVSYTRSYGTKGVKVMERDFNVVIRFSRFSTALRVAQWWNHTNIASIVSSIGKVSAIYIHNKILLSEQDPEPQLIQIKPLPKHDEVMHDAASPVLRPVNYNSAFSDNYSRKLSEVSCTISPSYSDVVRGAKRKAEDSTEDTDESKCSSTTDCGIDPVVSLEHSLIETFHLRPIDTMLLFTREFPKMLDELYSFCSNNQITVIQNAEQLKRVAADFKCARLRNLISKAVATTSSKKSESNAQSASDMDIVNMDEVVGMIWDFDSESDSGSDVPSLPYEPVIYDAMSYEGFADNEDEPTDKEFIAFDDDAFGATMSNGACGYVSICVVAMHSAGMLDTLDPSVYRDDHQLFIRHLIKLECSGELEIYTGIRHKIQNIIHIMKDQDWEQLLRIKSDLWLTIAETTLIVKAMDLPCRSWVWTVEGYKCFHNDTRDFDPFCYNLMYHSGHFYIHSDMSAKKVPLELFSNNPVPAWIRVGSSHSLQLKMPAFYHDETDNVSKWELIADHEIRRSCRLCSIYPSMIYVPPEVRCECEREGCLKPDSFNFSGADPMDWNLLQFYWSHSGDNYWLKIEQRQICGISALCAVAKRYIPYGTFMAPVVGVITTTMNSFNAVPCNNVYKEFAGTQAFLDPSPVAYDTGYLLFLSFGEIYDKKELPCNVSRYARVAWPSLDVKSNATFLCTQGESTVWIYAMDDIQRDEVIWIHPPEGYKLGFHPAMILSNPPRPSSARAIQFPKYWRNSVVECVFPCLSSEDVDIKKEEGSQVLSWWQDIGFIPIVCVALSSESYGNMYILMYIVSTFTVIQLQLSECDDLYSDGMFSDRSCATAIIRVLWYSVSEYRFLITNRTSIACYTEQLYAKLIIYDYEINNSTSWFRLHTSYSNSIMQCYINNMNKCQVNSILRFGKAYSSDNAGDGPEMEIEDQEEMIIQQLSTVEYGLEPAVLTDSDNELVRIASWNTNGHLVSNSSEVIIKLVRHLKLDILMLSDTRLDYRSAKWKSKEIKQTLRGYSAISMDTTRSSYTRGGGARMNTMGGTMFVISPRCAHKIIDVGDDRSGLGIAGYVKLIIGGVRVCVISLYQPIGNAESGESTVISRLQSYLHKKGINDHPKTYIMNIVSRWINSFRSKGFKIVIGGDFNADPAIASGNNLKMWANGNSLVNILNNAINVRYYAHMKRGCPITCIDHLYADDEIWQRVCEGRVVNRPSIMAMSDHCVVCMVLRWAVGIDVASDEFKEVVGIKRVEIQHRDEGKLEEYHDEMLEWFEAQEWIDEVSPADGLASIMEKSVSVVRGQMKKKIHASTKTGFRSNFKDGYSPCFIALKSAYMLILDLHNKLVIAARSGILKYEHEYHCATFRRLSIAWQKKYPVSEFAHDPKLLNAYEKADTALQNIRLLSRVDIDDLFIRAKAIRNLMHGRSRSEFRKRMSERVEKMEEARQQKRLGQLFRTINLKDKQAVDLSVLNVDGIAITDPHEIHILLTNHFAQWYRTPEDLHEVARLFQYGNFWRDVLDGDVLQNNAYSGVLEAEEFFKACKCTLSENSKLLMAEAVCGPITSHEYFDEIKLMQFGKAPGPSGVTATMVKGWPEVVHNQVFKWLNEIWESKMVPDWWLVGHLRPIPKSGEQSLDNLRPLGLYEISRKILTAIIIKRIYRMWESLQILLNPNQHAFRRGYSSAQAIMRIVNVSEDASERDVPLWQVLWDFRRAFDSIPFNFIRLALARLAVPNDVIEFLLYMMENNVMSVVSPFHMANHLHDEFASCHDETFHQERGTGQGDPPSPVIWIAIFDILLTMLENCNNNGSFYAQGSACHLYQAHDTAYADDLATISGSHQQQQIKADMVCTFCAFTGMQISLAKVRAFAVNCTISPPGLAIRDAKEQASIIAPSTNKVAMKYLGFHSDHVGGDQQAFEATKHYLQSAAARLIHCHAPKEVKLLVYRMQIIPKVMYMATKACWSLLQYKELDKFAARILKHIGSQMATSANKMMFFPMDLCGSGLNTISNMAQAQKWGEIARTLDGYAEAAEAAQGLLERAMRQTVQQAPPTQYRSILYRNMDFLKGYVGSLVEWGGEIGHCLTNSPLFEFTDSNKAILPYLSNDPLDEQLIKQLQKKDITVQGELTQWLSNGRMLWNSDSTTQLMRDRLGRHLINQPTDYDLMFNCGQMYLINDTIFEIIGIIKESEVLLCYQWTWTHGSATISRSIHHELSSVYVNVDVFNDQNIQRIITTPIKRSKNINEYVRVITSCNRCSRPSLGSLREFQLPDEILCFVEWIVAASERNNCTFSLFTDGSCRESDTIPIQGILWSKSQRDRRKIVSSAIIAIPDLTNWNEYECGILYLKPTTGLTNYGLNAFTAELIAIVVATQIRRASFAGKIFSDCKGAIEAVLTACTYGAKRSGLCTVRPLISSLSLLHYQRPDVEWAAGHPERRKAQEFWSYKDWGMYIADFAAEGDFQKISAIVQYTSFEIDISMVLSSIVLPGQWFWTDGESEVSYTGSEIYIHAQEDVHIYLKDRDINREERGEDARWLGTSLSIANKCWRTIVSGIVGSNIILKNVLDKYWHGRNRAKGLRGNEAAEQLACKICGYEDSQVHILLECQHEELCQVREEAIVKLRSTIERKMRRSKDSEIYHRRIMRFLLTNAPDNDYYHVERLWTGAWNFSVLKQAIYFGADTEDIRHFKHDTAMELQELIIELTRILTEASHEMMRIRIQAEREMADDDSGAWLAPPAKRCRPNSFPAVVAESGFPSKKTLKGGANKGVNCNHSSSKQKRQEQISKRRNLLESVHNSVSIYGDYSDSCNCILDTIGYVSHPQGETEDCDYDRD